jgi:predicted lipoprotein with Yx(FWY)xxD motif
VSGTHRFVLGLALGLASAPLGCGGDDGRDEPGAAATATRTAVATAPPAATATTTSPLLPAEPSEEELAAQARRPAGEDGLRVPARRARIVAADSGFGRVLFDANGQVVYVFENDRRDVSACTSDDCVKAWPPVLTEEEPSAGAGLDAALLGTIRRDDGTLQVTYAGRPLYFYEHEGPDEIRCHDVNLHGGQWWVVTPSGDPAD